MKISEDLYNALLNQWVEEKENSHTYLYIGAYLKNKGLDKMGKFFFDASHEEDEHAQSILNLLTDLNLDFIPRTITEQVFDCSTISLVADKFLQREMQTTQSLHEIKEIAMNDSSSGFDAVIEEHIRKMISQQQSELEESLSFKDKSNLFTEWWQVALWDLEMEE